MIKKHTLFFLFFLFATKTFFGQSFYDINTINTIELTFEESNWDYLLDQLAAEGNEGRLLGTATINGITYDSVGVRYKGNSTYNASQIKNPLNIKLDYIIDNQTHEDYGTLKLANVYKDPSFVREVLGYEIARRYFPASQSNFANVYINGTHLGLYTNNQDVDKLFMRTHFYSDENARIKGELNNSFGTPTGGVWQFFDTDSSSYFGYYSLESDFGWQDLIRFVDTLNNNNENLDKVLNIDRHLWFLAFSNLLVNLDGPINNPQNYYLYKDDSGRFNPIPWDLNECFGVFTNHQTLGQLSTSQLQQLSPFANLDESQFPIISKVLNNDTYRKMYVAHMKTIISDYFDSDLFRTRALEIQSIIDDDVQADANKFYTYDNFISNIDNSISLGGRPGPGSQTIIGITELMEARTTYLNSITDFQATSPIISDVQLSPLNPSPNTEVWITANITNSESVNFAYRTGLINAFEKMEMFDDGNHNDGSSGDGIYGVSVPTGSSGFNYYIVAENANAVSFLPEHAANEFYTLTVSNDLVINEFMASNKTTVADQDGEYADWIELYNNSDEEIQLNGYFLSDDSDDLAQWVFPDTSIKAKSYLIIWADKDEAQQGLHASFKLSGAGETIYLCDKDTAIINEISYSEQTTDLSTGRYPNGTGAFVQMNPTYGTENGNGITDVDNLQLQIPSNYSLSQNYPNPFNPTTVISFSIPESGFVTLKVFNILGQEVAELINNVKSAGNYNVSFDGTNLTSGMYIYRIQSGSFTATKKMVLVK